MSVQSTQSSALYASYKTQLKAEQALEDMYATGDVTPSEHPRIVRKPNGWYAIMVDGF